MQAKSGGQPHKDDLIVIGGAGGFIAGALVKYFRQQGFTRIRAVDKKPLADVVSAPAGRGKSVFGLER